MWHKVGTVSGSLPAAQALTRVPVCSADLVSCAGLGDIKALLLRVVSWTPHTILQGNRFLLFQWGTGSSKTTQMPHTQLLRGRMEIHTLLLCLLSIPGLSTKHGSWLLGCGLLSGKPKSFPSCPQVCEYIHSTRTHSTHT